MRTLVDGFAIRLRVAKGWFGKGKPLWCWVGVAFLLFLLPYSLPASLGDLADRIRWSGMLFQFFGLGTVVLGLNRSRKLFHRSSLWHAFVQWIREVHHIIKPPRSLGVSLTATIDATSDGTGILSVTRGGSIKKRVAQLQRDLVRLEYEVSAIKTSVGNLERQTAEGIEKERLEREAGDRQIDRQLEVATIGGIELEAAGLAYLYVGILFTSVPHETAWLLQELGL